MLDTYILRSARLCGTMSTAIFSAQRAHFTMPDWPSDSEGRLVAGGKMPKMRAKSKEGLELKHCESGSAVRCR